MKIIHKIEHRIKSVMETLSNKLGEVYIEKNYYYGANSTIIKLNGSNKMSYALKLYPQQEGRTKNIRQKKEYLTLKELYERGYRQIPDIKCLCWRDEWTLFEWIEGNKPNKISDNYLIMLSDYFKNASLKDRPLITEIGDASEAIIDKGSIGTHLIKRIKKFIDYKPNKTVERDVTG